MNSKPAETKEPLADNITPEEIEKLKAERTREGAACRVVTENNKRFLVCQWPPLVDAMMGSGVMFAARDQLRSSINGLDAAKAIALETNVAAVFSGAKMRIESWNPDRSSASDETGSKARTLLKRLVALTVRNPQDANNWQAAIDSL